MRSAPPVSRHSVAVAVVCVGHMRMGMAQRLVVMFVRMRHGQLVFFAEFGVKRKMSNFNVRHRGQPLHQHHQPTPTLRS